MSGCSKVSFNNPWHLNIIERTSHSNVPHRIIIPFIPLPKRAKWLYCMSSIDISFCGLTQLPDAIGCLHQLQSLNLGGNYFVSLLSLNELSKLVYLNLEHCVFLESLPQLPFPTALNWDLGINKIGLHIFNCPKLGERECRIAFSWLKQFIQANPQCSHAIDIVIPGSEIPNWFNNQSEGNRILIDYSPIKLDINNHIIGFLCCSLFSVPPSTRPINTQHRKIALMLKLQNWPDHQNLILVSDKERDLIKVKTNHIWLTYFPRKLSRYVPDFHGTMDVKFHNYHYRWVSNEVKNCGYGWLHKQDLQEFQLNNNASWKLLSSEAQLGSHALSSNYLVG
ncbi:disease resistance protein RUN1 [Trifolium repens]|nr:disease resistance protein RUN1 [Trifolium repens]